MNQRCDVESCLSPSRVCRVLFAKGSVGLYVLVLIVLSADLATAQRRLVPEQVPAGKKGNSVEQALEDTFIQAEQSVFVSAPREFLRPLIRANRAIAENDIAKAVSLLGEVLSESTSEDYLVPVSGTEGLSISLRLRAQLILGQLPSKDRQLYRLRYGVQAKQMLDNAIDAGDFELVSQVMQRFFFTESGYDAAMLLGHHHLDEGRPIAAANCFQRIADTPEARAIHDPEVSVLLAICWMLGESPDLATEVLVRLRSDARQNTIQFLGKSVRLFDKAEDAAPWLRKLVGDSPLREMQLVDQWCMVGGNPQRNARNGMGVPLLNPRWETPTQNNPDLEKTASDYLRELVFLDSAPIPAVQPLAIGNTVVMRAFDRMIGVDFETGKRVWVFPPWDFTTSASTRGGPVKTRQVPQASVSERLWLDAVYGQASSDGKSIFVVPNPGFTSSVGNAGQTDEEPAVVRIYNELMSIDLQREGAFHWEVGGETGLDEPKLAKSFFLGPPLPLQDELFVVCQQEKEIRLVVLDADSGRLKWSQALGTTENSSVRLADDRFRRLAGVSPSFANGILVCATGTGALTGIDLSTRSLLWGYQYTTPGRKAVQRISPGKTSNNDPLGGIWRDSSILIADGKVLFTPVEAQDLICVNLQNGFPAWKNGEVNTAKFKRFDALFLACVEKGLAILVGESSVRAISIQQGNQVWETELEPHGKPSGRGYTNHGCYFFPTTTEELVQIELATGKIVKSVQTDGVLGNLICYRGDVISHGVDRLATFPQDEPNRRRLAEAESNGELSAELWAIKSQLEIQDGNLAAAVNAIQIAYQMDPNSAYEKILMDLILRVVEKDFERGSELAQQYGPQLLANRRFEFLAAEINGLMQGKNPEGALESLFQLLDPVTELTELARESIPLVANKYDSPQTRLASENVAGNVDSARVVVRLDQWVASRIGLIYEQENPKLKTRIEKKLRELTENVAALRLDPVEHQAALSAVPMQLIPVQTRFSLASELAEIGESLSASKWLLSLVSESDPSVAGAALAELVRLALANRAPAAAQAYINRLETEFRDVVVGPNQTGSQFVDANRGQVSVFELATRNVNWNRQCVKSTTSSLDLYSGELTACEVWLEAHDRQEYEDYRFRFFGQTGEIEIFDANGDSAHRFFCRKKIDSISSFLNPNVAGRISIHNNVAVLDIATEIVVFDWLKLKRGEDPVLWNMTIQNGAANPDSATVSRQWGEIETTTIPGNSEDRVLVGAPGLQGICYLENTQLTCLDSLTGERLWQRSSIQPGAALFGDEDHVIVWNGNQRTADVYDIASGRLLRTTTLGVDAGGIWDSRGCRVLVSNVRNRDVNAEKQPRQIAEDKAESRLTKPKTERVLGLYDLLTDRFVWQAAFSLKSSGCLVQHDRIAILRLDGNLEMLDLQTGKLEYETDIGLSKQERMLVTGIGVTTRGDTDIIHLKRGETPKRIELDSIGVELKYLKYRDVMWAGHLICIDSTSGNKLWRKPARFDNFQLSQGQPANLPVYFLTRQVEKDDEFGNRRGYINFVGISMETGELLINDLKPRDISNLTEFRCIPADQTVFLKFATAELAYEFTEPLDLPPRPVAYLTNNNSVPDLLSATARFNFDKKSIERGKAKSLLRAMEAQKLIPQKQAEEKRQLEIEKAGK